MWYQRDDHQEVTVIFMPDLSEIAPTLEQAVAQWQQRQADATAKNPEKASKASDNTEMTDAEKEKAKKEEEEKESPLEPKDDEMEDEPYDDDEGGGGKKIKEEDKEEKKKEEPPREPSFLAEMHKTPESKKKLMVISLDGLLDYDETDRLEASFELSLFAESYHLMLQVYFLSSHSFTIFSLVLLFPFSSHFINSSS